MSRWLAGYTKAELDGAQERYCVRFPPDLVDLFLDRRPDIGYAWEVEDNRIREMLDWPFNMLSFDVERGYWWPEWGERPSTVDERREIMRAALATKPRLIPLYAHRFLPETPGEVGNPIFSMHGFDTIYYGANLLEYFENEFGNRYMSGLGIGAVRHIPFWSDIAERHEIAYAYYQTSDQYKKMAAMSEVARIARLGDGTR